MHPTHTIKDIDMENSESRVENGKACAGDGLSAPTLTGGHEMPIRMRALWIGFFLAMLICVITPFNNVYRSATPLGGGHFPLAPFYILFWLMLVGEIPTEDEVKWLTHQWTQRSNVPEHVFKTLDQLPPNTHSADHTNNVHREVGIRHCCQRSEFARASTIGHSL